MSATQFPSSLIPPTAVLDFCAISPLSDTKFKSVLEVKNIRFSTSGRASIALALEHANITEADEVLIPAYHCEAMVAPVKWLKAKPVFYQINHDTSIKIEDIVAKITDRTRALIVTHYFGFQQNLQAIREICTQHNIVLIEDCAHSFFGGLFNQAIGTLGDYAVASCIKFLPIYEGGVICSATRDLSNITLKKPPLSFQVKSIINCLEMSIFYNRLGIVGKFLKLLFTAKDKLWVFIKSLRSDTHQSKLGPTSSEGGYGLDENWVHKTPSMFSNLIMANAKLDSIAVQRRQNYLLLDAALANLPNSRPLFTNLPDLTVPWVYPLYVQQPEKYFSTLKTQGIPVWRFGEFLDVSVTADVCPVSVEYSRHIFQFPCHQSLTTCEIDWMLKKITQIFSE